MSRQSSDAKVIAVAWVLDRRAQGLDLQDKYERAAVMSAGCVLTKTTVTHTSASRAAAKRETSSTLGKSSPAEG